MDELINREAMARKIAVFASSIIYRGCDEMITGKDSCNPTEWTRGYEKGVSDTANIILGQPTIDPESLRPRWISVEDRLPEEKEYVMIWCGECQIARIEKGISKEVRAAMNRGDIKEPLETGWSPLRGYSTIKRSLVYKACDEQGNNRVPYCWYANGGPMQWFGQNVTHWMPLPEPPVADMRSESR